jgi:glycerol-3-phosphate dehydrogenase
MAMTVEDIFSRRTRATLRRAESAVEAAGAAAALLASEWGRTTESVEAETAVFADKVREDLGRAGLDVHPKRSIGRT